MMNFEESLRAKAKAAECRARGELHRSLKLYEISERLSPSQDVRNIISSIKQEIGSSSRGTVHDELNNGLARQLYKYFIDLEDKYIAPAMKNYIRTMILVIIALVAYKYLLKQEMSMFHLPGDISYSTQNVQVSFPIVSCLLLSFFMNALGQAFNSQS